jgi:predicted transcriptional regulator
MQRSIEFSDQQLHELEQVAAAERQSVAEIVKRAVSDYLARRRDSSDWGRRWDAVVEDVHSRMPSDVTPEEVEADITAASAEVREQRAALRRATGGNASSH